MQQKKADVYTRTGNEGATALIGGSRIEKDSARVEAYGTIDELCAMISVVKTTEISPRVFDIMNRLQDFCHDINADIAADEDGIEMLKKRITEQDVKYLENLIDEFDAELSKLTHFIVPTAQPSTAFLNLARTVRRRPERRLWTLY